jgi:hypothetical protein
VLSVFSSSSIHELVFTVLARSVMSFTVEPWASSRVRSHLEQSAPNEDIAFTLTWRLTISFL